MHMSTFIALMCKLAFPPSGRDTSVAGVLLRNRSRGLWAQWRNGTDTCRSTHLLVWPFGAKCLSTVTNAFYHNICDKFTDFVRFENIPTVLYSDKLTLMRRKLYWDNASGVLYFSRDIGGGMVYRHNAFAFRCIQQTENRCGKGIVFTGLFRGI